MIGFLYTLGYWLVAWWAAVTVGTVWAVWWWLRDERRER